MAEQVSLGRIIGYCGHLGKMYLDMRLRQSPYNITPVQAYALLYLIKLGGDREVMQRDLEHELHLKASTVNGIVDRLEDEDAGGNSWGTSEAYLDEKRVDGGLM